MRRFVQDDSHIFCREDQVPHTALPFVCDILSNDDAFPSARQVRRDANALETLKQISEIRESSCMVVYGMQVKEEVLDCLEFMKSVYGTFGMTYRLELSTRPEKALGDMALWDIAEKVRIGRHHHEADGLRIQRIQYIVYTRVEHVVCGWASMLQFCREHTRGRNSMVNRWAVSGDRPWTKSISS